MSRISHLSSAFKNLTLFCGEHRLRPITAGTIMLLMETKNALFSDDEREEPMKESEALQAMFEFIWIHIGPEEEVIKQCDNPAELRASARKFAMGIDFDAIEQFTQQFTGLRSSLQAAMVDPLEEGGPSKKPEPEKPLPISSPPSSSSSAEPEIRSESTTSYGGSLSAEPSNITTLPSPTTEHQAAGKSKIWATVPNPQPPDNVIPLD